MNAVAIRDGSGGTSSAVSRAERFREEMQRGSLAAVLAVREVLARETDPGLLEDAAAYLDRVKVPALSSGDAVPSRATALLPA